MKGVLCSLVLLLSLSNTLAEGQRLIFSPTRAVLNLLPEFDRFARAHNITYAEGFRAVLALAEAHEADGNGGANPWQCTNIEDASSCKLEDGYVFLDPYATIEGCYEYMRGMGDMRYIGCVVVPEGTPYEYLIREPCKALPELCLPPVKTGCETIMSIRARSRCEQLEGTDQQAVFNADIVSGTRRGLKTIENWSAVTTCENKGVVETMFVSIGTSVVGYLLNIAKIYAKCKICTSFKGVSSRHQPGWLLEKAKKCSSHIDLFLSCSKIVIDELTSVKNFVEGADIIQKIVDAFKAVDKVITLFMTCVKNILSGALDPVVLTKRNKKLRRETVIAERPDIGTLIENNFIGSFSKFFTGAFIDAAVSELLGLVTDALAAVFSAGLSAMGSTFKYTWKFTKYMYNCGSYIVGLVAAMINVAYALFLPNFHIAQTGKVSLTCPLDKLGTVISSLVGAAACYFLRPADIAKKNGCKGTSQEWQIWQQAFGIFENGYENGGTGGTTLVPIVRAPVTILTEMTVDDVVDENTLRQYIRERHFASREATSTRIGKLVINSGPGSGSGSGSGVPELSFEKVMGDFEKFAKPVAKSLKTAYRPNPGRNLSRLPRDLAYFNSKSRAQVGHLWANTDIVDTLIDIIDEVIDGNIDISTFFEPEEL
jgi:hypothetical protein